MGANPLHPREQRADGQRWLLPLAAAERFWHLGQSNRVVETWKPELHPAQRTIVHVHAELPLYG